jgi:hypothetical protein
LKTRPRLAGLVVLLTLAPRPSAARPASAGAGVFGTAGDGGYGALSLTADLGWSRGELSPYLWGELLADDFLRQATLGGGAWLEVSETDSIKAGAAVSGGRFKETDASAGAVSVELGFERSLAKSTVGAELRLSNGRAPGGRTVPAAREGFLERGRGRRAVSSADETAATRELAAYLERPFGATRLRPRVALVNAAGADVVNAGATWFIPAGRQTLSLGGSLSVGDEPGLFLTAGIYHRFF